jgi:hypothetical protein
LNRRFDAGIYAAYGKVGYDYPNQYAIYYSETHRNFSSKELNANLHLRFKFLGIDNARWTPYIVASVGGAGYFDISSKYYTERIPVQSEVRVAYFTGNTPSQSPSYVAVFGGGLGLDYCISKQWTLRYQVEAGYTTSDKNDMLQGGEWNDGQLQHSLGVVFSFGKPKAKAAEVQVVESIEEKLEKVVETAALVEEKFEKNEAETAALVEEKFEKNEAETAALVEEKMPVVVEEKPQIV